MTSPAPGGALVTGGARGIGRAVAEALARRGDAVVVADIDAAAAATTADELRAEGLAVSAVGLDVADAGAVGELVRRVDADTPLGTVVNNAGIGFAAPIVDVTEAQFDRLMAVNLRGVFFGVQAAARVMIPRGTGCIVNLASTSGFTASTGPMVVYDTSKGAVRMLTVSALAASGCASTPSRRDDRHRPGARPRHRRGGAGAARAAADPAGAAGPAGRRGGRRRVAVVTLRGVRDGARARRRRRLAHVSVALVTGAGSGIGAARPHGSSSRRRGRGVRRPRRRRRRAHGRRARVGERGPRRRPRRGRQRPCRRRGGVALRAARRCRHVRRGRDAGA